MTKDKDKKPQSVILNLASPEKILKWSHGEVTKAETINYRTGKPEKDGLFCEKIFGPTKDYQCYCGKYKGIRYKGVVCDRCGVEVTKSNVRRKRMGHIDLASPVAHIWFLKKTPYYISIVLGVSARKIEKVVYFNSYIITEVDEKEKEKIKKEIEEEFGEKMEAAENKAEEAKIKKVRKEAYEYLRKIKKYSIINEQVYRRLSLKYANAFRVETGAEAVREIFKNMDLKKEVKELKEELEHVRSKSRRKKISQRMRVLQGLEESDLEPEWMFLTVIPVLPPKLRPMVQLDGGRYASSDVNDLYRRAINRNNRLKHLLEIDAPQVIIRNEKRMLQEAVDALIDNKLRLKSSSRQRPLRSLADSIQGKTGHLRRNLLGKRVDYSGRSVIAVDPTLKMSYCGLPKKMALELFKPFVIKRILDEELAYNIKGANKLIEQGVSEIWSILEEVVEGKTVLLNRAPTLHRLGIQAFHPILIEGNAIKVHPLICPAYNADFDGDQMAVHVPLSEKAQEESKSILLSGHNLRKPGSGYSIVTPSQDMVLGSYFLTGIDDSFKNEETRHFIDIDEALLAHRNNDLDLRTVIRVPVKPNPAAEKTLIRTTVGRLLFNEALPEDYPFFNKKVDSKALDRIVSNIIEKFDNETAQKSLDNIKELGCRYSTLSGITLGMDDFKVPENKEKLVKKANKKSEKVKDKFEKGKITEKEKDQELFQIWNKLKEEDLLEAVKEELPEDGAIYNLVNSGARGSWAQVLQMVAMKGLVNDPSGGIIEVPVRSSFIEGFDVFEYFNSTHGARKGIADKGLKTAEAGYLTRRLVDVAHEVLTTEEDCGDKEGIVVRRDDADEINQDFALKIVGHYTLDNIIDPKSKNKIVKKGELINWDQAREIKAVNVEEVHIRSPLSCKTVGGVCKKCYGWHPGSNKEAASGEAVGVVAAQSIGEPGTQLTMRTFHLGGAAEGKGDIVQGLPRVEQLLENRNPKFKAVINKKEGTVKEIDKKKGVIKIETTGSKKKSRVKSYTVSADHEILVKKGQKVKKGQQLSDGEMRLSKMFVHKGRRETERYILREIQKVYSSQGVRIHDKHVAIIIRQMFARRRITEGGDSPWVKGKIVDNYELQEKNKELRKEGKEEAQSEQVLLGISKVALNSPSFLSAASFQRTSQVLVETAISERKDRLRGLKENVIIGKLIPAGTGYQEEN